MKGLFISGSNTNIGKTFIACHIIKAINAKYHVVARKPVESDCTQGPEGLITNDARLLNQACDQPESIDSVCQFKFEACVSGEKAVTDQGEVLGLDALIEASMPTQESDFVIVEGAGGFYSPIATGVLNSDLAIALNLPVVLIVKDELGAVSQALLCIHAAKSAGLDIAMLVLNRASPNDLDNEKALRAYTDVNILSFCNTDKSSFYKQITLLI